MIKKKMKERLRNRWLGKEDLVKQIVKLLNKNDESWIYLVKDLNFSNETKNDKDLRGIRFSGEDFDGVAFPDGIDLSYSELQNANLDNVKFKNANLQNSDLTGASIKKTDFSSSDLRGANLENIKPDVDTDWGTYFIAHMKRRTESKTTIKSFILYSSRIFGYKGKICSERKSKTKDDLWETMKIYQSLRIAYKDLDPNAADYFYYRESHCGNVAKYPIYYPLRWLNFLWEISTCSGSSPIRTLLSAIFIISIFSILYWKLSEGIIRITKEGGAEGIKDWGEALYFSIVTFTSLGYGDFHPNHDLIIGYWLKFACSFETLVGVVYLGVFAAITFRFLAKRM